jgi:hypothetical protein
VQCSARPCSPRPSRRCSCCRRISCRPGDRTAGRSLFHAPPWRRSKCGRLPVARTPRARTASSRRRRRLGPPRVGAAGVYRRRPIGHNGGDAEGDEADRDARRRLWRRADGVGHLAADPARAPPPAPRGSPPARAASRQARVRRAAPRAAPELNAPHRRSCDPASGHTGHVPWTVTGTRLEATCPTDSHRDTPGRDVSHGQSPGRGRAGPVRRTVTRTRPGRTCRGRSQAVARCDGPARRACRRDVYSRVRARRRMRSCSTRCAVGYPSLGLARHERPM